MSSASTLPFALRTTLSGRGRTDRRAGREGRHPFRGPLRYRARHVVLAASVASGVLGLVLLELPRHARPPDRDGPIAAGSSSPESRRGLLSNPFDTIGVPSPTTRNGRSDANTAEVAHHLSAGRAQGVLSDTYGQPVIDARVHLASADGRHLSTTRSDRSGRYTLTRTLPGEAYRLSVWPRGVHRPLVVEPFEVDVGGRAPNLLLEREPTGSLAGNVVDAQGRPADGFGMTVHTDGSRTGLLTIRTDTDGFFAMESVPAGTLRIAAEGPAFVPMHVLGIAPDEAAYVVLALDAWSTPLRGRVFDEAGTPTEGCDIRLRSTGAPAAAARELRAFTDSDGRFAIYAPGPPPWSVTVSEPASVTRTIAVGTIADPLEVYLERLSPRATLGLAVAR